MENLTQEKFLNDSELKKLTDFLKKNKSSRDSLLILMAIYTGARCQEILNIKKSDIKENQIFVRGVKNSNSRSIPVPDYFFKDLLDFVKDLKDDDVLFNISSRQVRRIWDLYRPHSHLNFHSLRHTMGVRLYKSCNDIHLVKTILGHKSISNTMIYMNYVESTKQLKEKLSKIWSVKNAS